MKITRYGNTETHLLFINYLLNYENLPHHLKPQLSKMFMTFVNYHYTWSGYYDKSVSGKVFEFNESSLNENFNK